MTRTLKAVFVLLDANWALGKVKNVGKTEALIIFFELTTNNWSAEDNQDTFTDFFFIHSLFLLFKSPFATLFSVNRFTKGGKKTYKLLSTIQRAKYNSLYLISEMNWSILKLLTVCVAFPTFPSLLPLFVHLLRSSRTEAELSSSSAPASLPGKSRAGLTGAEFLNAHANGPNPWVASSIPLVGRWGTPSCLSLNEFSISLER